MLLISDIDIHACNDEAFILALSNGHLDTVMLLSSIDIFSDNAWKTGFMWHVSMVNWRL